jgi:hypothetical protein
MKIYIVTAGEYSDYHIVRVFLDKEKAERYISLCGNHYDEPVIEEYETDDDSIIEEINFIRAEFIKTKNESKVNIQIKKSNTLDDNEEKINGNWFWYYETLNQKQLIIERVLKNGYDEKRLKEKYKKVCYDLMTKIESLIEIEGWTNKMIQEWLNQNADKYIANQD